MSGVSSSSWIVPVPVPSSSVAPTAPDSDMENVSLASYLSFSSNRTGIVLRMSPDAKVSVPDVSV